MTPIERTRYLTLQRMNKRVADSQWTYGFACGMLSTLLVLALVLLFCLCPR